jgi:O-antigen/teichoic acid export membrane protein
MEEDFSLNAPASVRQAFAWASAGRYFVMAINIATMLIMARLISPRQYGVVVLGEAVLAIAEAMRAVGGGSYIVQHRQLTRQAVRASFTISLLATLLLAACIIALRGALRQHFNAPDLYNFLPVAALGYLTGPVAYAILALLRRRMAFAAIAMVGVAGALMNGLASVALAARGFGAVSYAWGDAISGILSMLIYLCCWRDWTIFRPTLRGWRDVIAFGAFDGAASLLSQCAESLVYFVLGTLLSVKAVGLCQRTVLLCLFPERVILAGVGAVALPAFAQQVRQGRSLAQDYLRAIELITAALWPALLLMILLAEPMVAILLGPRWLEIVPLVRLLAAALLFSFPVTLNYPALVAAGGIRYMPAVILAQGVVSLAILTWAAWQGLYQVAFAMLLVVPLNGVFSLALVRHFVGFRWTDIVVATRRSALCCVLGAIGPVAMLAAVGARGRMSFAPALFAVVLFGIGWLIGLRLTRHKLLDEMLLVAKALRNTALERPMKQGGGASPPSTP